MLKLLVNMSREQNWNWAIKAALGDHKQELYILTLYLPDWICNSPYCQSYNFCSVSSENLVLDQVIIPKLIFFFILIT